MVYCVCFLFWGFFFKRWHRYVVVKELRVEIIYIVSFSFHRVLGPQAFLHDIGTRAVPHVSSKSSIHVKALWVLILSYFSWRVARWCREEMSAFLDTINQSLSQRAAWLGWEGRALHETLSAGFRPSTLGRVTLWKAKLTPFSHCPVTHTLSLLWVLSVPLGWTLSVLIHVLGFVSIPL